MFEQLHNRLSNIQLHFIMLQQELLESCILIIWVVEAFRAFLACAEIAQFPNVIARSFLKRYVGNLKLR